MTAYERKKEIVIGNYFKTDCSVDTSIREAYRKGFERGLSKIPDVSMRKSDIKDKLPDILRGFFSVGNSYTYELTRMKSGLEIGTVTLDDFVEWGEEQIRDLAQYIIMRLMN